MYRTSGSLRCWCGNADLARFNDDYFHCQACQTLITAHAPAQADPHVRQDESEFYGKDYWLKYQDEIGNPGIIPRSRTDLSERALYWLESILNYKAPPGKVLELGCAHGGFVAMLRWTGFDATGLELSPWIVDYARKVFDIPALLGPLEDQQIPDQSLDIIAQMDVLEHLPDPLGTMAKALSLLKPDGFMAIQTPRYPEGVTFEQMKAENHPFLIQLKPKEHLFLYSQQSVVALFRRLGAEHVSFERAIFAHYDMFPFVSRAPLTRISAQAVHDGMTCTPCGRSMEAMLDLNARLKNLEAQLVVSESDRAARLANMRKLETMLSEAETDRTARWRQIEKLGATLAETETDRAARGTQIETLTRLLKDSETDRDARLQDLRRFEARLKETEADRAARLDHIRFLERRLVELENEKTLALHARTIGKKLREVRHHFTGLTSMRFLRALRSATVELMPAWPPVAVEPHVSHDGSLRVAIDMTPLRPGGDNGGAKIVAMELVKAMSRLEPVSQFFLLTAYHNHDELAALDAPNVSRVCVLQPVSTNLNGNGSVNGQTPHAATEHAGHPVASRNGKGRIASLGLDALRSVRSKLAGSAPALQVSTHISVVRRLSADVLFCPFTAATYYDPAVATVCVVHDLQYQHLPHFFSPADRAERDRFYQRVVRVATKLICVSEFVRGTVLEDDRVSPHRAVTVPHRLAGRLPADAADPCFGLKPGRYLLYPANFWLHKNHALLLTALGVFHAAHPNSDLRLVCTGAPDERQRQFVEDARKMGLGDRVICPGYLSEQVFAGLVHGCRAIVFPSLYEGFGMPVAEAMAQGKPVLCSDRTSLPEVIGDAGLIFDPRRPDQIAAAIARIDGDDDLCRDLARRGKARAAMFTDTARMAQEYLHVFREAIKVHAPTEDWIQGIYPDGWTSGQISVMHTAQPNERELEMILSVPPYFPVEKMTATLCSASGKRDPSSVILRGHSLTMRIRIPAGQAGLLEFRVDPLIQPKQHGMGDDERWLGCRCEACGIVENQQRSDLLTTT